MLAVFVGRAKMQGCSTLPAQIAECVYQMCSDGDDRDMSRMFCNLEFAAASSGGGGGTSSPENSSKLRHVAFDRGVCQALVSSP